MGNILSYFFPEPEPAHDGIEQVIVDTHEGGETGRDGEGLPALAAVEDVVVIVDEKLYSTADLVTEKELKKAEKDLIELSEEGFEVVEDNKVDIESVETLRTKCQSSATLVSMKVDQDEENTCKGDKVDFIGSFNEMAEESWHESDNESVDSPTLPDIETKDSDSPQPIEHHTLASMVSSTAFTEDPAVEASTQEQSQTLKLESADNLTESPELKLLTPEFPKYVEPEPVKATDQNESPKVQLSEPCQLLPSEPSASTLAPPAYEPEIVDNTAVAKPRMAAPSPSPATAADDDNTEVEEVTDAM